MIWGKTYEEQREREDERNNNWFAWRPVRLDAGQWVWLQRIRRVFYAGRGSSGYDYYLKEKQA